MHPIGEDPNSPSFNSYFNTSLADVVTRVTEEFAAADISGGMSENGEDLEIGEEDRDAGEFEFSFSNSNIGGDSGAVYPVFDRGLLRDYSLVGEIESRPSDLEGSGRTLVQLKNLFLEDRDGDIPSSSSSVSSQAEELDGIPEGTYCVWTPNKSPSPSPSASPSRCTKSSSTGSLGEEKVKAWKLRDLLKRSRSDGKNQGQMMLLTPKKKVETPAGRAAAAAYSPARGTAAREMNKRRSYLPYRQDLVGFFVTPHTLRKMHLSPF